LGVTITIERKQFHDEWWKCESALGWDMQSKAKHAVAIFLKAYKLLQTLESADLEHFKDLDRVIEAFERHSVGEFNVAHERYLFSQRTQATGESFDAFLSNLCRLLRTCQYGLLEDFVMRDQIVIGIADDATRQKLLKIRHLDLATTIDICRTSEGAPRQLKLFTSPENVQRISAMPSQLGSKPGLQSSVHVRGRSSNALQCWRYCDLKHEPWTDTCPAYGQLCCHSSKTNHWTLSKPQSGQSYQGHDHDRNDRISGYNGTTVD